MMTVYRFRFLLVLMTVLWVATILLDFLAPDGAWGAFDPQDYSTLALAITVGFSLLHVGLFVLVVVGLYRLRRWGRILALVSMAYSILSAAFIDSNGEAGMAAVLYSASGTLMVALIAAAYWAPSVSESFDRRA